MAAFGDDHTTATELSSQAYHLVIENSIGCSYSDNFVISQPDPIEITVENIENTYCNETHGSAIVSAAGGNGNSYDFMWDTSPPQLGPMAFDLGEGNFNVTVTDRLGCIEKLSVPINNNPPPSVQIYTEP